MKAKYGNLFDMYKQIAADDPHETPMKIYLCGKLLHCMGGLWVDWQPHDCGARLVCRLARRISPTTEPTALGASALMQGLADGYCVLPYTIGDDLASDIRIGDYFG